MAYVLAGPQVAVPSFQKTPGTTIRAQLESLILLQGLPSETASALRSVFNLLTEESLDCPIGSPYSGLSRINSNGLPFQWSICLGEDDPSVRFLCEVGRPGSTVAERLGLSTRTLSVLCEALGLGNPDWLTGSAMALLVPAQPPQHWGSGIWFGIGAINRSVIPKVYFNLDRGEPSERWLTVGRFLGDIGRMRAAQELCDVSELASPGSLPVGLAIDCLADGQAGRVKLYFRSTYLGDEVLARWFRACNAEQHSEVMRHFLDSFPTIAGYPPGSFIISLEFPRDESSPTWRPTLKIDLAVTLWKQSDTEVHAGILRAVGLLGISDVRYKQFVDAIGPACFSESECVWHRFVGIGYETNDTYHVNVYVEPWLGRLAGSARTVRRSVNIADALTRGVAFLVNNQEPLGNWRDFNLAVGQSDGWVTAFILRQLSQVRRRCQEEMSLGSSLERATHWLMMNRKVTGGWGYNGGVPEDGDSTALGVLALRGLGIAPPSDLLERLRLYVGTDGGARTYLEEHSHGSGWSVDHHDVAGTIYLALISAADPSLHARARERFVTRQLANGLWPSYWWLSPLYATAVAMDYLAAASEIPRLGVIESTLTRFHPSGAFEIALHLQCLSHLEKATTGSQRWLHDLARLQADDGSWPGSALLRLTFPSVASPWETISAGTTFHDIRGLFTTATVVEALSRWYRPANRLRRLSSQ